MHIGPRLTIEDFYFQLIMLHNEFRLYAKCTFASKAFMRRINIHAILWGHKIMQLAVSQMSYT